MAESRAATASSYQACQSFGSWGRDREDYEQGPGVVSRGFVSEPVR